MAVNRSQVEDLMERSGFVCSHETKKVVEYRSSHNGKVLYFRTEIGLPEYVRLVVHPDEEVAGLIALSGVAVTSPKEFQHGSNMSRFPGDMCSLWYLQLMKGGCK